MKENNILEFDRIIFPMHVTGNHWTLGSIDMIKRRIEFYDSLGKCPPAGFYELVKKWLRMLADALQVDLELDGELRLPPSLTTSNTVASHFEVHF